MFANPWYLQQQAAKQALMEQMEAAEGEGAERAGDTAAVDSQNNQLGSSLDTSTSSSHSSSSGRGSAGGGAEAELSHSPSPAPSVVSAGSCGSGNHNTVNNSNSNNAAQLAHIQSSLKPGWTVHITPEGRLYYCK